ncbi:CPBP family intramembrane metalloprotease [Roseiflexus sp. AH-315-K22]|nr:CPBP family intramembrane metalloprotease [Roseiflexus sp. AH-315-K22]
MRSRGRYTASSAHAPEAHSASSSVRASRTGKRYEWLSTRPLHILAFLLPFIIFYWVGSALFLSTEGSVEAIKAERILGGFFDIFGVVSPYLSGIALIVVLLVWHLFLHDRWRVHPRVVLLMGLESTLWMLPLLVAMALLPGGGGMVQLEQVAAAPPAWAQNLTIAIGAGIYEELLFRMILIAMIHLVLVDLVKLPNTKANIVAVIVSSLAFAVYHDGVLGPDAVNWPMLLTFFTAGCYFGVLYLWRGFGIAVGVHALYDIVVLVLLAGT